MIHIFHGDNQQQSRLAFNQFHDSHPNAEILRLDPKDINLDQINNFLNGNSFFPGEKIIAFTNFFSISKPILEKIIKFINITDIPILIWQDKLLNATQLKIFPKAQTQVFKQNNPLWACLNSLQPHNSKKFFPIFNQIITQNYDLFLYLVKNQLRKQLVSSSLFSSTSLKRAYLRLIDLDFANKTGQLTTPNHIAMQRVLFELMEH